MTTMIISYMDIVDLARATGVCMAWRTTVKSTRMAFRRQRVRLRREAKMIDIHFITMEYGNFRDVFVVRVNPERPVSYLIELAIDYFNRNSTMLGGYWCITNKKGYPLDPNAQCHTLLDHSVRYGLFTHSGRFGVARPNCPGRLMADVDGCRIQTVDD
jgi:hypothetical protein